MRAPILLSFACLLALGSCKGSEKHESSAQKQPPGAGESGGGTAAAEAEAGKARPVEPDIPVAELQALLDTWLKAQNQGDFAAYEKLYAEKFTGVKRVGPKTFRYARKGWLANRKLMFRHEMTVEARDPEFDASARVAKVTFTQRWASGKFEDLGPKRMQIVREGDALKIAQEEMLRSEIISSKDGTERGRDFYFLLDGDLVLHDAAVPDRHGKPKDLQGGDPLVVRASVEESDLDEETLAFKGKKVRVDGDCEATVTGFYLVSRITPHFGVTQEWSCTYQEDDCEPATDEQRAEEAFEMGHTVVVATLDGCGDGTYARPVTAPAIIDSESVKDSALEQKAVRAFGRLGAVKNQAPEDEAEGPAEWWKGIEKVSIFKHPESGQILVSVHADNGGMCGEFSANAWVLWEYKDGKLVRLVDGTAPQAVLDAIDVDRDGALEILVRGDSFGTEAALVEARTMSPLVTLEYDYGDCPC